MVTLVGFYNFLNFLKTQNFVQFRPCWLTINRYSSDIFYNIFTLFFQVAPIRGDKKAFFVSYVTPHKSVTARTLARWIKSILAASGVDTALWDPHSTRSAAVAHQKKVNNLDLGQICRLADWSLTSGVYRTFYSRYV